MLLKATIVKNSIVIVLGVVAIADVCARMWSPYEGSDIVSMIAGGLIVALRGEAD